MSRSRDPLQGEQFHLPTAFVTPRTPAETALAEIWAEILDLGKLGILENFFELGGDSLTATQVVSRVRDVFHVDLPLSSFFETPTVAGLAARIEQRQGKGAALAIPPLAPAGREGPLPLGFSQERIWFVHQLEPQSSAYNVPAALRLSGPLDRAALELTLHDLVRRHEAFRTTFASVDGQPVQVILPGAEVSLEVIDLRELPGPERESRAMACVQEHAARPFDLCCGPLLRVLLLQLGDQEHLLLLNMHHIISDAWSLALLMDEMSRLYNGHTSGEPVSLAPLAVQYADFAVWQRGWLRGEALEAQLAYWRKQLDDLSPLQLPTDYPRPAVQTHRGALQFSDLPSEVVDGLKRLSHQEGATLSMALLAAFDVLLYRYTRQEDIAIAVPIANRNWLAIEEVVGSFVNTLVMRTDLSGTPTVRELLRRVRQVALDAYVHQDLPYAKLVAELQPERDASRTPLAQVMFNVINVAMPSLDLKDLQATPFDVDYRGAQFDLTLTVIENAPRSQIQIEYNTDLFAADTIERMMGHFRVLLDGMVADAEQPISSLPMLTEAERRQMIVGWNETQAGYPENATLVQLFEAQVERTPDAPAFLFDGQVLSYGALNRRANQVAHYVRSLGIGPEVTVGVLLSRSLDMVVAVLGVLKAGGAYLPLDPAYPQERLAFMLRDAGAPVLLTEEAWAGYLPEHDAQPVCLDVERADIERQSSRNPASGTDPDSLAYVLYTSGSTGRPKGVLCPHRGGVNRCAWMWNAYPFQADDVCCQKTSMSFVDSVWELFGPLLQGVPSVIVPDAVVRDPQQMVQLLAAHRVTRIALVPSLLKAILDAVPDLQYRVPALRFWTCSSEPLPVQSVRRFREIMPEATLLNLYGSSEDAADVSCYDTAHLHDDSLQVPIGRPIANTQIYLLDPHLNPVPAGVPGEIYVGGASLARGYLNKPELTAERFVPDPFRDDPAARLYKTGDLARYQPDGNIDILGRRDHQCKIRGFRIELGEIEVALRGHPGIAQAAVLVVGDGHDAAVPASGTDLRLHAYLVSEGIPPSSKELRSYLGPKLPGFMIPSAFSFLDALPLNPNGKIDRHALAKINGTGSSDRAGFVAPRDPVERRLVPIWEEVLGSAPIGVRDNFFDLGGHSLLAIRLFARIREAFGIQLPVATLFQAPTVEQLAGAVRQAGGLPGWSALVPIQPQGSRAPFFCVHGIGGGVLGYAELARLLGPQQPVYGLQARGFEDGDPADTRIEDMAARYIEAMRGVQPRGPYCLGGYSFGGVIAFEMACMLQARGDQVALLALLDTYAPLASVGWSGLGPAQIVSVVRNLPTWIREYCRREGGVRQALARMPALARAAWQEVKGDTGADVSEDAVLATLELPEERRRLTAAHFRALESYCPQVYPGQVTLFRVRGMRLLRAHDDDLGWGGLAAGGVEIRVMPGAHYDLLERPQVDALAAELKASLHQAHRVCRDDRPPAA